MLLSFPYLDIHLVKIEYPLKQGLKPVIVVRVIFTR